MKHYLVQATGEEKRIRDEVTYEGWGQKLTLAQYLKRESILRENPWNGHTMTVWLLKNEDGQVLSSCEAYPILSDRVIGIGSVFTEEKWRGRGFAAALLIELAHELSTKHPKRAQAMILFSEVGERIYQRAGFHSVDSYEWVLRVGSEKKDRKNGGDLSLLTDTMKGSAIRVIRREDDLLMRSYPSQELPLDPWVIHPSEDQLRWHFQREKIYAEFLGYSTQEEVGAALGGSFWIGMMDYKWKCLRVLTSQFSSAEHAHLLMAHACEQAREREMNEVRIWESDFKLQSYMNSLGHVFHAKRIWRDDSIAMIRSLQPEVKEKNWTGIQRGLWI